MRALQKEAGAQGAVRVFHRRLDHEIARSLAHRRTQEFQSARKGSRGKCRRRELHRLSDRERAYLRLRHIQHEPEGRQIHHTRHGRVGLHILARFHHALGHDSGKRRADHRIGERFLRHVASRDGCRQLCLARRGVGD